MTTILPSLLGAFRDFFSRKMIFAMIAVPLACLAFWVTLLILFWTPWTQSLGEIFSGTWAYRQLAEWYPQTGSALGEITAVILLLLLVLPVTYLTSLLLVSQFVVPFVQRHLLKRDYADLERRKGGSFTGSLGNALRSGLVYVLLFLVTAPMLLLPGAQILLPAALTAWISRRVLTYDLLQDVASDEERRRLLERHGSALWMIGFLFGLLVIVPGLGFFLPVLATLAYGHFCYARLRALRGEKAPSFS